MTVATFCVDGNVELATSTRYDGTVDAWQMLPDLQQVRGGVGLLVRGGRLYAIGGGWQNQVGTVESLSLNSPLQWQTEAYGLNYDRRSFAAASDGSTLLVAGGWNGSHTFRAEIYLDDTLLAHGFE